MSLGFDPQDNLINSIFYFALLLIRTGEVFKAKDDRYQCDTETNATETNP
jgi:hypothetical protein